MVDSRCPQCRKPVVGTQEIRSAKPGKIIRACQHCGAKIKLASRTGPLGLCYYYVVTASK